MLNRWVRTWGCAVRTEHWLELDCLDFETGSVEMLFVLGTVKKCDLVWETTKSLFTFHKQQKKGHVVTVASIQKQSLQTKNPITWAHAAIKCNGGHVNKKTGRKVSWIGAENNWAFLSSCTKIKITNDLFGFVACFLNHPFWATRMSSQNKSRMASKFWEWHGMETMASWRTLEQLRLNRRTSGWDDP